MLEGVIEQLQMWGSSVDPFVFVVVGAFVEEIISPIPSSVVMTLGGTLFEAAGYPMVMLFIAAFLGAVAKTIVSQFFYYISDKIEDLLPPKLLNLLGFDHSEIEGVGKYLNKGKRDDLVLFALRAIPIIPSLPVSLMAGFIKINPVTHAYTALLGFTVRNFIFLALGYWGTEQLENLSHYLDSTEKFVQVLMVLGVVAIAGYIFLKRKVKLL